MNKNDLNDWFSEISNCKCINNNRYIDKTFKPIKIEKQNENVYDVDYKQLFNCNCSKTKNYQLDANTDKKLRTGNYKIDKVIDFHGYTIEEAFSMFIKNINYACENNFRCLLFITGKGKNSKNGSITIKESFEKWTKIDYISEKILKCCAAAIKDGGSGAFYVLIKKNKDLF